MGWFEEFKEILIVAGVIGAAWGVGKILGLLGWWGWG